MHVERESYKVRRIPDASRHNVKKDAAGIRFLAGRFNLRPMTHIIRCRHHGALVW